MKNIFLILFMLFAFFACKGDKPDAEENIWDKNKLVSYIQYADDDITEAYHDEFEYNMEGLLIGAKSYLDGIISGKMYDFIYNGNKRTFLMDNYMSDGKVITTGVEEVYLDNSFSPDKLISRINTIEGEVSREEYTYDDRNRETGYKVYYLKTLDTEYDNYSYDDEVLTSRSNFYSDGAAAGKRRVKTEFYGNSHLRSKVVSRIQYQGESNTEYIREEYTYDPKGRENGYKTYYLGNLTNEQKNYVYDNISKELTFDLYGYSQHESEDKTSRNKVKIIFY